MRVVTFADGFTSTSPPDVEGRDQESYDILNNQTDTELFDIDSLQYKSAFIDFELSRSNDTESYLQTGSMVIFYDGSDWILIPGMTQNDEILSNSLVDPQNVTFSFTNAAGIGTLSYSSGNMDEPHVGKLKLLITRIKEV